MESTEGMKAFAEKYNLSLDDPKLRGLYEYDLSARRDQAARDYTNELFARTQERTATISNMIRKGFSVDLIYDCINAPRAEIDSIIANLNAANGA